MEKSELSESKNIIEQEWLTENIKITVQQWRHTFDAISDIIFITDIDGKILRYNKAMENFTGKHSFEILNHSCWQIIHNSSGPVKNCPLINVKETLTRQTLTLFINDGWFNIAIYPLMNENRDFIGTVHVMINITELKNIERKLLNEQAQLRTLASKLSLTEEKERRRIASDLHDNIGQTLAIAKIKLGEVRDMATSTAFAAPLNEINRLIAQAIHDTRAIISDLSPPILYELGLVPAVEWLIEKMYKQYGLLINFQYDAFSETLPDNIRVLLFQIIRELLMNIVKHAQTKNAKVFIKNDNNNVSIIVEDKGKGFNAFQIYSSDDKTKGFGLFNIRERINYMGGYFDIKSVIKEGTRVKIVLPLEICETE